MKYNGIMDQDMKEIIKLVKNKIDHYKDSENK